MCIATGKTPSYTFTEPQPIFAKWRQLARSYGRATQPTAELMLNESDEAVRTVEYILVMAGVYVDTDELSPARVREKILDILERCSRLRDAIGEGVVTCDFRVTAGDYGELFDGERMEDAFNQQEKMAGEGVILCASELGLERFSKSGDTKESGEALVRTIPSNVKAKVVTTAAMDELVKADGVE